MPPSTADATLLPPPFSKNDPLEDQCSTRSLDSLGVEAALGAMVEQKRRASAPDAAEVGHRVPSHSEVFLKAR